VATVIRKWAGGLGVDGDERARWLKAVYYHDAVKDASAAELIRLVPEEPHITALKHGPAAAVLARGFGENDQGVLDAVEYHSVGYAGWDRVGKMLYMADYLEPGRRFRATWRRELKEYVLEDPHSALFEVTRARVQWLVESGWPLPDETTAFWNSIVNSS
jgi:2-amino-4-hydroxy-6-hydroxymethyldihydropteridine diphosphokinase